MSFIVILSGGLDSAVSAFALSKENRQARGKALFFDYGQKAAKREKSAAKAIAKALSLDLECLDLAFLKKLTHTALVMNDQVVPQIKMEKLDSRSETEKSAQAVWVPNRNGLFLNIAACYAEALGIGKIAVGFNAEEAMTFPDNSANFVARAESFFALSTLKGLEVVAPTIGLNKREIVQKAKELGVPLDKVWSCYLGGSKRCGTCESCLRSIRAFHQAGLWQELKAGYAASPFSV
ncbi:MAG: 7-cyano-7-deazaguanine synthase QueC [Deltaproteobacteria bacterium]|nr:7-cyano-7-deazaguanine synthase QueC [Deltaproteobacteria bacterium]